MYVYEYPKPSIKWRSLQNMYVRLPNGFFLSEKIENLKLKYKLVIMELFLYFQFYFSPYSD